VLQGAALTGAAVLTQQQAAMSQDRVAPARSELTADEIRRLLDLEPNATCGFVRVTFVDKTSVAPG
jgi:hypothetical protein